MYLASALGVLLATVVIGSWFISQSIARQVAAARLQADFVSAVSHEFRTPLTLLCQLTELLKRGRVASEGDRQQYYELLHKESDRLRRLVENLLTFGRVRSDRLPLQLETLDLRTELAEASAEFARDRPVDGHRIE
ncbi:sensor histidine kinase, partial [Acinetobacter baumannii]|uniref:sensor histidine kinase n=1 Tax=Acinetobacter baumannii TaxID=470 RepID=UPI00232B053B